MKYPKEWKKVKIEDSESSFNELLRIQDCIGFSMVSIFTVDLSIFKRTYFKEKIDNIEISNLKDDEIRLLHLVHSLMGLMVENPKETKLLKFGSTTFADQNLGEISFSVSIEKNKTFFFKLLSYKSFDNIEILGIFMGCPEVYVSIFEKDFKYIEQNWQWN